MELTAENYYSSEANKEYMSVSQYKDFVGAVGMRGCEFAALEKLEGRWEEEPSDAMVVGSYVDSYYEGTLDAFKTSHPELFTQKGELYSKYKVAEEVIKRTERDEYFQKYMSGEKQRIMTGELFGTKWKIKMDSYIPDVAIVDLKVVKAVDGKDGLMWVRDMGHTPWFLYWGYDIQGAIYQKIVEINTGKKLPFYLAAASKEKHPSIQIIQITQNELDDALSVVEYNMPRILRLKNKEAEPDRCEMCDCCREKRILTHPISASDLMIGL